MIRTRRFPLCPFLSNEQPGFDCFSQPHLIGEDGTTREWISKSKQSGLNLVRIEIHLGVG